MEGFHSRGVQNEIEHILLPNSSFQLRSYQIAGNDLRRLSISFDKNNSRRATAERFNSKGAASREKIEDPRTHDGVAQAGKDGRFHPIHCWSHSTFRNCQADSAGAAGDHSHGEGAGVAVAVASGGVSRGEAEVDGTIGIALPASAG
jgi:hypothetical protein